MGRSFVILAGLLLFAVVPAIAAEFYVAQDPSTKQCKIVKQKPDGTSLVMIGTSSYATRDEAKSAKKTAAECQIFFVAQDPSTKKCKMMRKKPDGTTMIMIGTSSYKTKEEAIAALKAAAECKPKSQ